MASSKTSQLISDLDSVPGIVGNLGLSIAAAQKAFNLDFLESLERLLPLIRSLLGKKGLEDKDRTFIETLLKQLAPSTYQYTETSLGVRLDLAQSERKSAAGQLGVGTGAVTLSAGMSASYGLDYRAAAEVRTVIQATKLDPAAMTQLLERAKTVAAKDLELPEGTPRIDKEIAQSAERLAGELDSWPTPSEGSQGEPLQVEQPATPPQADGGAADPSAGPDAAES